MAFFFAAHTLQRIGMAGIIYLFIMDKLHAKVLEQLSEFQVICGDSRQSCKYQYAIIEFHSTRKGTY
jgi:hypothetical protein